MIDSFREKLKLGSDALGIELSGEQIAKLYTFADMLLKKNRVMNLTAIRDEDGIIYKHFIDSLSVAKTDGFAHAMGLGDPDTSIKVLDVGTGAGMPGLVLKIAYPKLDMTLLDSVNKKLLFLSEVIRELGLKDAHVLHGRAEDLGHDRALRESFDLVLARAVAPMPVLAEYCLPFVKPGGIFTAYKSGDYKEELESAGRALEMLCGRIFEEKLLTLPVTGEKRCLISIVKKGSTPDMYPRKAGIPKKRPL